MYQHYAKKQVPRFSLNKALIENSVFSNFNYCSLVWHFTSMTFTKKMFQKRVNRLLYNDYSSNYDSLLANVNKP